MTRTIAVLLLLLAVPLTAQEFESYSGLHVRFDAPGARSRAMGGASLAMSDIFGTATNPASIATMKQRSAAIEGRYTSTDTTYLSDTTFPFTTTSEIESSSATRLSSAVAVIPTSRGVYSVFYDEPLALRGSTITPEHRGGIYAHVGVRPNGEFVEYEGCGDCLSYFFTVPSVPAANANVTLRRIGTAGAWQSGTFTIGGGVRYEMLDEEVSVHSLASGTDFSMAYGHDNAITWNAGLQWQLAPSLRVGASYQSGAEFENRQSRNSSERGQFDTPTTIGAGLAFEPLRNLTIAADAVRVHYSELVQYTGSVASPLLPIATMQMPDVTELHAGAEYRLGNVALRAGWWRDPAHRMRAVGNAQVAAAINLGLIDADENHVTAGIGYATSNGVRIDAAIDRGERSTRASVALATTF